MRPNLKLSDVESNRAVSPVIGVILMVAITVILAAVIGAFVLEIGDQQETAPNTSFDSEENRVLFEVGYQNSNYIPANMSVVTITHAGGSVVDETQARVSVEGNDTVLQNAGGSTDYVWASANAGGSDTPLVHYIPKLSENKGGDQGEFNSGESYYPFLYGGSDTFPTNFASPDGPIWSWENAPVSSAPYVMQMDADQDEYGVTTEGSGPSRDGRVNALCSGDEVSMIWSAASGGKTQSLFSYTVQSDSSGC